MKRSHSDGLMLIKLSATIEESASQSANKSGNETEREMDANLHADKKGEAKTNRHKSFRKQKK